MRKLCPFKLVDQKAVTSNCLAVQLKSASNQELEIVFVRNPNDEKDKISNLSKAFEHLAENGSKNQIIIEDFNTSLNTELNYVGYTQDPHKASREFLHGLQDDAIFIDVYGFLYPCDYRYTWKVHRQRNRILAQFAVASFYISEIMRCRLHGYKLSWRRMF